jgi:hypothetical protein
MLNNRFESSGALIKKLLVTVPSVGSIINLKAKQFDPIKIK